MTGEIIEASRQPGIYERIEDNKKVGGHYDDNINIWENDVQLVAGLSINSFIHGYETSEWSRLESGFESLRRITLFSLIYLLSLLR